VRLFVSKFRPLDWKTLRGCWHVHGRVEAVIRRTLRVCAAVTNYDLPRSDEPHQRFRPTPPTRKPDNLLPARNDGGGKRSSVSIVASVGFLCGVWCSKNGAPEICWRSGRIKSFKFNRDYPLKIRRPTTTSAVSNSDSQVTSGHRRLKNPGGYYRAVRTGAP
jgi:hypothetical protein